MTSDTDFEQRPTKEPSSQSHFSPVRGGLAEETNKRVRDWEDDMFESPTESLHVHPDFIIEGPEGATVFEFKLSERSLENIPEQKKDYQSWLNDKPEPINQTTELENRLSNLERNVRNLSSLVQLDSSEEIPQSIEERPILGKNLEDRNYINSHTIIPQLAQQEASNQVKEVLASKEFLKQESEIEQLLEEEYNLGKDTIDEIMEFKDRSIDYHRESIKVRKKWRKTESLGVILFGLGLIAGVGGLISSETGLNLGLTSKIALTSFFIVGLTLIYSGFQGLKKSIGDRDD